MSLTGRRRLYLMRHGHVDYFAPGLTDFRQVPLTEVGTKQAKTTGEALGSVRFDAVFTSGLPRTIQTAKLVLAQNDTPDTQPQHIPTFEELRGGNVTAETREELAAWLAFSFDEATEPGASFLPGGEAFADGMARVKDGLETIVRQHEWKTALLVAHDGINRLILGHVCGAGLAGIGHFEQDLACVNILDFDVVPGADGSVTIERIIIKALNLTAYDPIKGGLPKTSLEHMFEIDFGGARPARPHQAKSLKD